MSNGLLTDTDSDRIRLIPEMMNWISQLNQVIITGNLTKGEPGLLEDVRNIRKDVREIKNRQANYEELERRVGQIEERHKKVDSENSQRKDTLNRYNLAVFGVIFTQIVILILNWLQR